MAPPQHPWHPEDIKAEVRKRGSTLAAVARAAGFSTSAGNKVLRQPWPAMERVVAAFLNIHPSRIWPDRYDDRGDPLIEGPSWKDTGRRAKHKAETEKTPRAVA